MPVGHGGQSGREARRQRLALLLVQLGVWGRGSGRGDSSCGGRGLRHLLLHLLLLLLLPGQLRQQLLHHSNLLLHHLLLAQLLGGLVLLLLLQGLCGWRGLAGGRRRLLRRLRL
jgi:hypothetical protein